MSLGLKKRVSRTVPFGYKINEEDNKLLEPIQEELEAKIGRASCRERV